MLYHIYVLYFILYWYTIYIYSNDIINNNKHMYLVEMYAKEKYRKMYLDYVNNFLTVEKFAEHYQIPVEKAKIIINTGKNINNEI